MKLFSTLLLIMFSFQGFSQDEVEWFQPGQEWYYRISCLNSIDCGAVHYSVDGTDVIGGLEASVLTRTETFEGSQQVLTRNEYLHYASDTVWRYSIEAEEWHLLYDIGAQVGDIWTIQDEVFYGYSEEENPTEFGLFKVRVDSVSFWEEIPNSNIENRRVIFVSPIINDEEYSGVSFGSEYGVILEGIGSVADGRDIIGNPLAEILVTYPAGFQCFLDNGELTYGAAESPCFTLGTEEIEEVESGLIYPNPAQSVIFWDEPIDVIRIFDATGKQVLHSGQSQNTTSLSVENLETGFYTVVIERDKAFFSQKMMIQQ